jgi:hypothetical protein
MNVGGDNLLQVGPGLIDINERGLEGNTIVCRKGEASNVPSPQSMGLISIASV